MKHYFTLPYPPTINTYYRAFNNRIILSAAGREYKKLVKNHVILQGLQPLKDSKLKITMRLHPRDKRKIDIDNRIKAVLDALENAGLFNDDFQIDELIIRRGVPIKDGKLYVLIEEIA
jgi:crossover junction endodeoxyribonuclease RusA